MVETVAAYLAILEIGVRLARSYGTWRARAGLSAAGQAVATGGDVSIEEARAIVNSVLRQHLGEPRSSKIVDVLSMIEILTADVDLTALNNPKVLPPYAAILKSVAISAHKTLNARNAFAAWGVERQGDIRYLRLPMTTKAFKSSLADRSIKMYAKRYTFPPYPALRKGRYVLAYRSTQDYSFSILVPNGLQSVSAGEVSFSGGYELHVFPAENDTFILDYDVFYRMLEGVLADMSTYHYRASAEIELSRSRILRIFRPSGKTF